MALARPPRSAGSAMRVMVSFATEAGPIEAGYIANGERGSPFYNN